MNTTYIVIRESILAYVTGKFSAQVLASKLSHVQWGDGYALVEGTDYRPATLEDFSYFRVVPPPEVKP